MWMLEFPFELIIWTVIFENKIHVGEYVYIFIRLVVDRKIKMKWMK